MKLIITFLILLSLNHFYQHDKMKEIQKNNMTVKWKIDHEFIYLEMAAPTNGWVAIGFNESASLPGTYLLMGRVVNGKAEVVEHYTAKQGSYKPIHQYGVANQAINISGTESGNITNVKFSIPVEASSKYQKHLLPGTKWTLLMAYSLDDDFQHHSIMRTSVDIML